MATNDRQAIARCVDIRHHLYEVVMPDGTTDTEIEATASLTREDFDRIAANLLHLSETTYTAEVVERLTSGISPRPAGDRDPL